MRVLLYVLVYARAIALLTGSVLVGRRFGADMGWATLLVAWALMPPMRDPEYA